MSVKLATQVFSLSVAAAIRTSYTIGELKLPSALLTAAFIESVNNLFDALNSKSNYSKQPSCVRLDKENVKGMQSLQEGLRIMRNIKRKDGSRPPCFDGFLLSVTSILASYQTMGGHGIFTDRFNQDPLENYFSVIRQKGKFNRNPMVKGFRTSYRQVSLQTLVKPPKSSNCDLDEYRVLPTEEGMGIGDKSIDYLKEIEEEIMETASESSEDDAEDSPVRS
ncbi:hypothetical protein J437_LFUL015093 [Ladona fulva]|uniref:Uncharacterized protein n=1 Tax=Ladona fulva TaxID=123851 RepID=A0A8K0P6S5_LADFU|nr:hypothetical protein J437_LFUL015093 [Ladona fulva]